MRTSQNWMRFHKALGSLGGIGYIGRGGGTVAAALTGIGWICVPWHRLPSLLPILIALAIVVIGVWSSGRLETIWGKDNRQIVIDEVLGMTVSMLGIPVSPLHVLIAFVLFRYFDIAKPLFIRNTEQLPRGWGVMGDDLLAGIYANLCLRLLMIFF